MDMTSIFEKIKGTVVEKAKLVSEKTEEVVSDVAKKTEQTVEVQKIKVQIHTMERNNERDYKDIGKMIYDRFKKGEGVDGEFIELCDAIAEREDVIAKAKQEIAKVKGLDVCAQCDTHIEPGVKFCPNCGAKTDTEAVFDVED